MKSTDQEEEKKNLEKESCNIKRFMEGDKINIPCKAIFQNSLAGLGDPLHNHAAMDEGKKHGMEFRKGIEAAPLLKEQLIHAIMI